MRVTHSVVIGIATRSDTTMAGMPDIVYQLSATSPINMNSMKDNVHNNKPYAADPNNINLLVIYWNSWRHLAGAPPTRRQPAHGSAEDTKRKTNIS